MNKKTYIFVGLLLIVGIVIGALASKQFNAQMLDGDAESSGRKVAYWVAPMDPNFRRDTPGSSPMGMALVPVYADEAGDANVYEGVEIDPRIVANIGVKTAQVVRDTKAPVIRTVAHAIYNEKDTSHVHVRASGWIEKLHVRATGEAVEVGTPLFDVYSPELNTAQAEYLQAVSSSRAGLVRSAQERLIGLGLSLTDVEELKNSNVTTSTMTVRAPIKGVVTALNVSDQARITTESPALTLVDLDTVWLIADVFEMDIPHVKRGTSVSIYDVNTNTQVASSTIDYVYPDLNMQTRTNPMRIVLDNANKRFRPGQFFKVDIERAPIENALFVPANAIIRLGHGNRVILSEGNGQFRPAAVTVGETVGEFTQVLDGLAEGETVVVGSQFLIDSESSFQGASVRLTSDEATLETETFGMGQIISLDRTARRITIQHQAVESYDWLAGERSLDIAANVPLDNVTEAIEIHFGLARKTDSSVIVTAIHVMGDDQ